MVGLREYLTSMRETVRLHRQKTKDAPLGPKTIAATVTAMGGSGVRRIQIREFNLISDARVEIGGYDLGPTPTELLMGALGACIASSFLWHAAMRGIAIDDLVVDVSGQNDPRGELPNFPDIPNHPHNIQVAVKVNSPASDEELNRLLEGAEANCSISNLIRAQETVTARLERVS